MALDPQQLQPIHLRHRLAWLHRSLRAGQIVKWVQKQKLLKVAHRWTRVLSELLYRFSVQTWPCGKITALHLARHSLFPSL